MNIFNLKDATKIANSKRPFVVAFSEHVSADFQRGAVVSRHKNRELAVQRIRMGGSPQFFVVCDASDYVSKARARSA